MEKGYLALILHAHLPYVRHPEYNDFLEEDWFFEAITETYIPLINVMEGLVRDKVDFRLTMSLTPTLISMLTDPFLQSRYLRHLEKLIELSQKEIERTRWEPQFNRLALMYNHRFNQARRLFAETYNRNLVTAFRNLQEMGKLEIITCAATHGYLPLMELHPQAVAAQIKVGVSTYQKHLGRLPRGIWLPECGYHPGADAILKKEGLKHFIAETHAVLFGSPRPKYGIYSPCYCPSGVAIFSRDTESSKSVWSAKEGYPGDHLYREFYRDVGYDLDYEYIKPYLHGDGQRVNTGIKYYRITGPTNHKEVYLPDEALKKAAEHAGNFMFNREKQIEFLYDLMKDRKPIIVCPYDAELFGHWWFEGPDWINFLCRKIYYDQKNIKLITPSEYMQLYPRNQVITPSFSSWGWKGYSEVWLEGSNDWIYRHYHKAVERMIEVANQYGSNSSRVQPLLKRALNQMARELLLAQSSDWAFIMKTRTFISYAEKRFKDHLERFTRLYEQVTSGGINEAWLGEIESKDNLFPDLDYTIYRT